MGLEVSYHKKIFNFEVCNLDSRRQTAVTPCRPHQIQNRFRLINKLRYIHIIISDTTFKLTVREEGRAEMGKGGGRWDMGSRVSRILISINW